MPEGKIEMKDDPFGNLMDWVPTIDILKDLSARGELSHCQPGLIRILRYRGNWRLREEVLKCVGEVHNPSNDLVHQVIAILDDDNIYYDARILAGKALLELLSASDDMNKGELQNRALKVVKKLLSTPQPPFFNEAVEQLHSKLDQPRMLEN